MSLKDEILARSDCAAAVAARDLDAIAAIVSAGRMANQSRFVTERTILAEIAGGNAILDALQSVADSGNTAVRRAINFLQQDSGLDVGNAVTQGMIDQLAATNPPVLAAGQAAALKGLANLPAPVSRADVEAALFNADGSSK